MSASKNQQHEVIIIGAGFSGIGLAIRLKQIGIEALILERGETVGGVWRDNTYPAAACDVPSKLYSFSFAQNTDWSRSFSTQPEILEYLKGCVKQFKLTQQIKFNQAVRDAHFDPKSAQWSCQTHTGETYSSQFLISACGQLCEPAWPNIKGMESFEGTQFHSAQWDHQVDIKDKQVAVIGTGASAIQFVPEIATQAASVSLYQRTPPYVLPKRDRAIGKLEKRLMAWIPGLQNLIRKTIYSKNEFRALYMGPLKAILKLYTWRWRWFMHRQIKDPVKRQQLTPDYVIGCKRILIANNYYSTLNQAHVHLISEPIKSIKAEGVVSGKNTTHQADVIIYATGFKASEFLSSMQITGLKQQALHDRWSSGAFAYCGMSLSGFPNFLICYGPNTNIGHNSMIHVLESQFNYICDYIEKAKINDIRYLDLKPEVETKFKKDIQNRLSHTVWQQGGCQSWYQTQHGHNTNNWPGLTLRYRLLTKSVNLADYDQTF